MNPYNAVEHDIYKRSTIKRRTQLSIATLSQLSIKMIMKKVIKIHLLCSMNESGNVNEKKPIFNMVALFYIGSKDYVYMGIVLCTA